ncbi:peptidase inhibitor family I36 protein [Streptomyces niveus]|uniref:peptidase inhibitor family I36 protein n=1 Tax=Streptomyces niveus TaxID=193462 RepID=UPI0033EE1215
MRRLISRIVVGSLMAGGITALGAAPASAACQQFILYYHSNQQGACWHTNTSRPDLANTGPFSCDGDDCRGAGEPVKNNAASGWNWYDYVTAVVYYNSNYKGAYDVFRPLDKKNLVNTYNENASVTLAG